MNWGRREACLGRGRRGTYLGQDYFPVHAVLVPIPIAGGGGGGGFEMVHVGDGVESSVHKRSLSAHVKNTHKTSV